MASYRHFGLVLLCLAIADAQTIVHPRSNLIRSTIDSKSVVELNGNIHPFARTLAARGLAPDDLRMERMLLRLNRSTEQQDDLDRLLVDLQEPKSPAFHKWLTPSEFGARFGATDSDLNTVTSWLRSQGFQVSPTSRSKTFVEFSGTAKQVSTAFHVQLHRYRKNGQDFWANDQNPQIPAALAPAVSGFVSLYSFQKHPQLVPAGTQAIRSKLTSSDGTEHALTPSDAAIIYNATSLQNAPGEVYVPTIAVVGRSNIDVRDVQDFVAEFGAGQYNPQITVNGVDPGNLGGGEEMEALLDTSWAGALYRANVNLVISKSTNATDGVDLSLQYIVDNNAGDVITESFGSCEADTTAAEAGFHAAIAQQAAAQGMTLVVSAGDSGSAGCDEAYQSQAHRPHSVNMLASNPYTVAVGGTQFNEGNGSATYWSADNSYAAGSAQSYIPETVWNESSESGLWAGGGGASVFFAKPSWQTGLPGIPMDGARDLPDVSLSAAMHDPYVICVERSCSYENGTPSYMKVAGTSAAAPLFASMLSLIESHLQQRLGQVDPLLYRLAAGQKPSDCNGSISANPALNTCTFHDVTAGTNAVPGEPGYGTSGATYQAGPGYDQATGLGSVNVANLFAGLQKMVPSRNAPPVLSLSTGSLIFGKVAIGTTSTQTVTVTNTGGSQLGFYSEFLDQFAPGQYQMKSNCDKLLLREVSCKLTVSYTPTSAGMTSITVELVGSTNPTFFIATGIGVATDNITVSANQIVFPRQSTVLPSAVQTVTLTNSTSDTVSLSGIGITGSGAAQFLQSTDCPPVLAPAISCHVALAFQSNVPSSSSAVLTFATSDSGELHSIPLTGSAFLPATVELINGLTGEALGVADTEAGNGAAIVQLRNDGTAPEQWRLKPIDGGFYTLINAATGLALDDTGVSASDGTHMQQYAYQGSTNQQWRLDVVDDSHFKIINRYSGKALDIPGGSRKNGVPVQQWASNANAQQLWTIVPATEINLVNVHSGSALDLGGPPAENGTPIVQFFADGAVEQQWQLLPVGKGFYALANRGSGKVLDVTGLSRANGALIQQYDYQGTTNQHWRFKLTPAGAFEIENRGSGKALDLVGATAADGAPVQQWPYHGGDNQQWFLRPVALYALLNKNSGAALDVPGGSTDDGLGVQQWASNGGQQQQWELAQVSGDEYFIINNRSGKALGVRDHSYGNGATVEQNQLYGYRDQLWRLVPRGNGSLIVNLMTGKVLDVTGVSKANGASVQQYDYQGGLNQLWSLEPTQ